VVRPSEAPGDGGAEGPSSRSRRAHPNSHPFLPPHIPTDLGSRRQLRQVVPGPPHKSRQSHLYGKNFKSTRGHQTHLPARTCRGDSVVGARPTLHKKTTYPTQKTRPTLQSDPVAVGHSGRPPVSQGLNFDLPYSDLPYSGPRSGRLRWTSPVGSGLDPL
jgi:hypothetical protein